MIKFKINHRFKLKHKAVHFIENYSEKNLQDLELREEFLDMPPKSSTLKRKVNNLDFKKKHKKTFSLIKKDLIKKMKRQVSDWQKIFANLISDKGHVLRIYKEHTIRNGQKI